MKANSLNYFFAGAITIVSVAIAWIGWTMVDSVQKVPAQLKHYHKIEPKPKTATQLFDTGFSDLQDNGSNGNGPDLTAIGMAGNSAPDETPSVADFMKTQICIDKQRFAEAIPLATKALKEIETESKTKSSWTVLAQTFEKAMYQAHLYQGRAYCYLQLRQYKLALADLDVAIKLNPNYLMNYENRSKVYRLLGKNALAAADAQRAKELATHHISH